MLHTEKKLTSRLGETNALLKDRSRDAVGDALLIAPLGLSHTSLSVSSMTPTVVATKGTSPCQAQVGNRMVSIGMVTTRRGHNPKNCPKSSATSCAQKDGASHVAKKGMRAATAPHARLQGC